MKNLLLVMMVCILAFAVTGCAGYKSDFDNYSSAYVSQYEAEAERVIDQSEEISEITVAAIGQVTDPTAKALIAVFGQIQIAKLHPADFTLAKPRTWADVWETGLNNTPVLSAIFGMGYVANQGLKSAGNINMQGETLNISESFNPMEVHATGSGNSVSVPFRSPTTTDTTTTGF